MAVIVLSAPIGSSTWNVPPDWSNVNLIECIGGGGGGASSNQSTGFPAGGGGGGAYSATANVTGLSGTIAIVIGAGGTAGTAGGNGGAGGDTSFNAGAILAKGGSGGLTNNTVALGGQASAGAGGTRTNGGNGAAGNDNEGTGGGGAGGPLGAGGNGGLTGNNNSFGGTGGGGAGGTTSGTVGGTGGTGNGLQPGPGTAGGNNAAGAGGGAGGAIATAGTAGTAATGGGGGGGGSNSATVANGAVGGAGGSGTGLSSGAATVGGGGGGGGGGAGTAASPVGNGGNGGQGGLYGGGGGGGGFTSTGHTVGNGAAGGQGVIVITYTPAAVTGTNYFVSSTATGAGTGTIASPWTIAQVNAHTFNGADKVFFDAGHAAISGTINLTATNFGSSPSPSSVNPVTFDTYAGTMATINSASTGDGFDAIHVGGLVIRNLQFTGSGVAGGDTYGMDISTSSTAGTTTDFVQILNCTVSGYGHAGIWVNTNNNYLTGLKIAFCTIHDCGGFHTASNFTTGMEVQDSINTSGGTTNPSILGALITNCTIYNIPGNINNTASASGMGFNLSEMGNSTIQYCLAHDCGSNNAAGAGPAGIGLGDSLNTVIQYCECYNISDGGHNVDGDGYNISACVNCTVQYCYSHDCSGTGYLIDNAFTFATSGIVIRYCVSQNDGTNASSINRSCLNVVDEAGHGIGLNVYNNTFYSSNGGAAILLGTLPPSNINNNTLSGRFNDNIFYTTTGSSVSGNANYANVFDGNVYYRTSGFQLVWNSTTYTTLATWKAATGVPAGTETHSGAFTTVNPLLASPGSGGATGGYNPYLLTGYLLQGSSPAKNAGLNLNTLFGINQGHQDFAGMGVPNPSFNVGALDTDILAAGQALL